MPPLRFPVAVIFQRTPLANRWVSERWEPVAVEPDPGAASTDPVKIADNATEIRWRFGGCSIELHPSEAEGYHLNITSPDPKVFVMWRRDDASAEPVARPAVVTVSYNEAARMLDGGEQVDAVPLPADLLAWIRPFVAEHYKPEPRRKARRNDPFRDAAEGEGRGPRQ
jgi:uncharacterized protein DUF3305